jgi:hypothetical protein
LPKMNQSFDDSVDARSTDCEPESLCRSIIA